MLLLVSLLLIAQAGLTTGDSPADPSTAPVLGPWFATGPIETRQFDEALPPEQTVDLNAVERGQPLWQRHDEWVDGQVHALPGSSRVATYLFRTITVSRPIVVNASLGSDDGIAKIICSSHSLQVRTDCS
jgi:hypothetical protein